jgi:hypothetical protein
MRIALQMFGLAIFAAAQVDGLLGISMPFSAMNMRTMRGLGPIES